MNQRKKVLVIGGGIAGLAAAKTLIASNYPVMILEARSRLGGRIMTDYSLGVPLDLGASLIHGIQNNPITGLVNKLNLSSKLIDIDRFINFNTPTRPQLMADALHLQKQFSSLLNKASEYAWQIKKDCSLLKAIRKNKMTIPRSKDLDSFLNTKTDFMSLYFGTELDSISARYWDAEKKLEGGNYLMLDGYQPLIEYLSQGIPVHLNTQAIAIHYGKKFITIETSQGLFEAETVIITAPLSILKNNQIKFYPELPVRKREAIDRLQMGVLDKIVFKFDDFSWFKKYIQSDGFFYHDNMV